MSSLPTFLIQISTQVRHVVAAHRATRKQTERFGAQARPHKVQQSNARGLHFRAQICNFKAKRNTTAGIWILFRAFHETVENVHQNPSRRAEKDEHRWYHGPHNFKTKKDVRL